MSPNWWLSTRTPWKLAMVNMQAMSEPVESSHRRCLRCWERVLAQEHLRRWRMTLHPDFNVVCLNVLTACLTTYKELRNPKTDVSEVRKFKILSEINRPKGDFFCFSFQRSLRHIPTLATVHLVCSWLSWQMKTRSRRPTCLPVLCQQYGLVSLSEGVTALASERNGRCLTAHVQCGCSVWQVQPHRHWWSNMRHWSFVQWHRISTTERFSWSDTCTSSPCISFLSLSLSLSLINSCARTHTHARARMHTRTCMRAQTRTHKHTHTHTQHTHTHTLHRHKYTHHERIWQHKMVRRQNKMGLLLLLYFSLRSAAYMSIAWVTCGACVFSGTFFLLWSQRGKWKSSEQTVLSPQW